MKKYIIPVTEVHSVRIEGYLCVPSVYDQPGGDEQFGKDYDGEDVWE